MGQSLIDQTEIFIDGIHIKAAANNHKYTHKVPDKQAKFMSDNWELRLTWIGKNTAWALKKTRLNRKIKVKWKLLWEITIIFLSLLEWFLM